MKNFDDCRQLIKGSVLQKLAPITGICSITFVGSFEHATDISAISDVDIIVITDKLNESLFRSIEAAAGSISAESCGLPGFQVKLNMSFGPLKFNDNKTIVFHLMVYDRESHRRHVIDSPFTCFDWEFYSASFGKNLSAIYPVASLQLSDLISTRRGLESYLADINKGAITFRRYLFQNNEVSEQKEEHMMDDRHKKEYAYHVMKFLLLNLSKILRQNNDRVNENQLTDYFNSIDPVFMPHTRFFIELYAWKRHQAAEPADIFNRLALFIDFLNSWLTGLQQDMPSVCFYRHGKTALNDGTFLGIHRNPGILPVDKEFIPLAFFDRVITGDLKRTIDTGALFKTGRSERNNLLNEINYGSAEGLTLQELNESFPELSAGWQRKEDPAFPQGENQQNVVDRLDEFLEAVIFRTNEKNTAVITHNVVIRVLLGKWLFKIPAYEWYRLCPAHMEPVNLRIFKNTLLPELDKVQRIRFRDQIVNWK